MFVVIEGIEGSGKSTLHKGLVERLSMEGRDVVVTREPGGTATGDAHPLYLLDRTLTIDPLTETFLGERSARPARRRVDWPRA